MATELSVGISLGGENCSVAVHNNSAEGRYNIAANADGDRTTPACVAFLNDETLIGNAAKAVKVRQPKQTVTNVAQLLNASLIKEKKIQVAFDTEITEVEGESVINVPSADPSKAHDASALTEILLKGLKAQIVDGACGGQEPSAVVVAAPRYLDRAAIERCTEAAGWKDAKVRVIASDVAAVMAQRHDTKGNSPAVERLATAVGNPNVKETSYLVIDWGGSSCAVSLISSAAGSLNLIAYDVDFTLGATDVFDKEIVKQVAANFQKKTKLDPSSNGRSMRKLAATAQNTKHALSSTASTSIEIEAFCEGTDLRDTLSRMKFESLVRATGVIDKIANLAVSVAQKGYGAEHEHKDGSFNPVISEIILTGGACRTPIVAKNIKANLAGKLPAEIVDTTVIAAEVFDGFKVPADVSGDEASAVGACMQATIMSNSYAESSILDSLDGVHDDDGINMPALYQNIGVLIDGKSEGELDANHVAVIALKGTLLPFRVTLNLPKKAEGCAIRLAAAGHHDNAHFKAFGTAVEIPAGTEVINVNLRQTKHDGLEVRVNKGPTACDTLEGGKMTIEL